MTDTATVIIARAGDGDAGKRELEDALAQRCAHAGWRVLVVPHLYHLPEDSPLWQEVVSLHRVVIASWLHPRPAEWLLRRHGMGEALLACTRLSLDAGAEECYSAIRAAIGAEAEGEGTVTEVEADASTRWYPVVDDSRCINCHHCFQFCLFGVYVLDDEGRIDVRNPGRCKPGCPACSRICPQGAIIFPLYEKDEAIAGAPGKFMSPDLAARKMYYLRTKLPCPVCGGSGEWTAAAPGAVICQECGRALAVPVDEPADDDIDALIDELDGIAQRRR